MFLNVVLRQTVEDFGKAHSQTNFPGHGVAF